MLSPLTCKSTMDNQDLFSKLGSGEITDNSDHLLEPGALGGVDDPFNDSGGDFFDKFLAEEAERSKDPNNGSSNMLLTGNDSGINTQSLLEAALNKDSGSLELDVKDMDEEDMNPSTTFSDQSSMQKPTFNPPQKDVRTKAPVPAPSLKNSWFKPGAVPSAAGLPSATSSRQMNPTLDAAPLNVSLGSGITSTLRRKGSNLQLNSIKANSVIKANMTSSKIRSNKSDGLLARALKARYNSSGQVNNYNVNAAGAAAAISAKLPRNAMSALGAAGMSNSAMNSFRSKNALFGSNMNLNAVEENGSSTQNASWGAVPGQRKPSSASLIKLLAGSSQRKSQSKLVANGSTSSLLKHKIVGGSTSRSSMQDLLRLCKRQSKTQTLLRQSSAHSLMKQTSSQSLKDISKKVDVSSLLPPQHAALHANSRKGFTSPMHGSALRQTVQASTSSVLPGGGGGVGLDVAGMGAATATPMAPSASSLPNQAGNSTQQSSMETSSLLHQSCRLYPTTAAVVESALRIDEDAVRRAIPVPLENGQKTMKPQNVYGYPVNVAMTHGASKEVLEMLAKAGPDVLVQKDGTDGSGSLGIALTTNCDMATVNILVQANPACVKVADRRGNYPLHVAVNFGLPLDIVKKLYAMYPKALQMRNFHSQTPLDIAQRSTRCAEEVMNFLQSTAFSPLENDFANHIDHPIVGSITGGGSGGLISGGGGNTGNLEDGLDDIMETNF